MRRAFPKKRDFRKSSSCINLWKRSRPSFLLPINSCPSPSAVMWTSTADLYIPCWEFRSSCIRRSSLFPEFPDGVHTGSRSWSIQERSFVLPTNMWAITRHTEGWRTGHKENNILKNVCAAAKAYYFAAVLFAPASKRRPGDAPGQ